MLTTMSKKPFSKHLCTAATALLATGVLVCVAALASVRSTKEGAFTTEQAERGKVVYDRSCKNCHQVDFYRERLLRWQNKSVGALFQQVSTTMPSDNVGSLLTSEYIDVLAYVFSITGSPAGSGELTTDTMDNVNIALSE